MPQNSRIPRSILKFNIFIRRTNSYMLEDDPAPLNWVRIGWTQEDMDAWTAFLNRWMPLMSKYSDKKVTRTTDVTNNLYLVINDCVEHDKTYHLIDRIASSTTATLTDYEVFNIKKGILHDSVPSVSVIQIEEEVFAQLSAKVGGSVKISCRTKHDRSRPSKPVGADCVRYAYRIGGTPPFGADDEGLIRDISTRASFILKLGTGSAEKKLYIFFQWYNTKHPNLAGDWSNIYSLSLI